MDSIHDFPALGSSPSKTNALKPVLAKASWKSPVASAKEGPGRLAAPQPKKDYEKQATKKCSVMPDTAGVVTTPQSAVMFFQPKKDAPEKQATRKCTVMSDTKGVSTTPHSAAMFFQPKKDVSLGGDEYKLLRLVQDRNVYQKKGRQRLHPRKKKFTALKKKVLQERLQKWHQLHPEEKEVESSTILAASTTSCSVCIYNYVHPEELEDDDEYNEVLENLQDLASKVGPTREIFIPRKDRTNSVPAFVHFEYAKDAAAAQACWEGLRIGGETLRVIMISESDDTSLSWNESVLLSETAALSNDSNVIDTSAGEVLVMELSGILTEDDYGDEDCMGESLEDLRTMASKLGKLQKLEPNEANDGGVLLHYEVSPKEAETIFECLQNTTLGGRQLSVTIVSEEAKTSGTFRSLVVLENILTEDDLEDEDCLNETLVDIRSLAGRHGEIIAVQVVDKLVKLTYEGPPSVAERSAKELNDVTLTGVQLIARVETDPNSAPTINLVESLYLHNILTDDDLDDDDCLQESMNDIRTLASKHGTIREIEVVQEEGTRNVRISYDNGAAGATKSAIEEFDGMVVGGLVVTATLRPTLNQEEIPLVREEPPDFDAGKRGPDAENNAPRKMPRTDDVQPLFSGDKLIPERFAQAKRIPKIPNQAGPRAYAKQVNDERVRPLLLEMLGELMRLQKRAVEENNTKVKRRLVLGLREVARGIRSHKIKMLVMANNLDEYGVIDEKLQEIIDLSENEGVPLFFEFTKRSLGKAVGKNIKVAVVGVQNAEGAHQQFKKLVSLAFKVNS